jgi:hypothetical protein
VTPRFTVTKPSTILEVILVFEINSTSYTYLVKLKFAVVDAFIVNVIRPVFPVIATFMVENPDEV